MRICEMTATFGKLDGQTLTLKPGMNWIVAPNEWGKSTWCAFLTAMLYGIDTRERSGKDHLAEKERYAPWSGKPMEGILRLEHQGRYITIERRTKGRVPLGDFRAYETDTGLPVRELTAENCALKLLGVERSVFRRTGFIRLQEMPVTQDEALRRRLNALVTTADESGSADRLAEKLRELKNRCRYNRSGLIPQTAQRLEQLRSQLQQRQALDARLSMLTQKEQETGQMIARLECHWQWLEFERLQEGQRQLRQAEKAQQDAFSRLERCKNRCGRHLSRRELEELLARQPAPLAGRKKNGVLWMALGLAALLAAGVLVWQKLWPHGAAAAAAGVVLLCIGLGVRCSGRRRQKLHQTLSDRREQWLAALADWEELERSRQEAVNARQNLEALQAMVFEAVMPEQEDSLDLGREQTRLLLDDSRKKLGQYRQLRGECLGRMDCLPQAQDILRQIEQTELRLKELEKTYTALGYAQKALEEAMDILQRRFAPRITRRTQELLSRLTKGRYDLLSLSQELTLTASARGEVTQRGSLWRSDGTVDQMYLALRIAVWEELMPQGPLVLDDALVRFDQERLQATAQVLEELSQNHQIIVFACR